ELGVDRAHVELAFGDRHAAVVVAAAYGDDWAELVLVVPEFFARRRVDRVDVIERRREKHYAVVYDRRGFHRLEHRSLEHERRLQLADILGVELLTGIIAAVVVVAVGVQPVLAVLGGVVEHRLGDRRQVGRHRPRYDRGAGSHFLAEDDPGSKCESGRDRG